MFTHIGVAGQKGLCCTYFLLLVLAVKRFAAAMSPSYKVCLSQPDSRLACKLYKGLIVLPLQVTEAVVSIQLQQGHCLWPEAVAKYSSSVCSSGVEPAYVRPMTDCSLSCPFVSMIVQLLHFIHSAHNNWHLMPTFGRHIEFSAVADEALLDAAGNLPGVLISVT